MSAVVEEFPRRRRGRPPKYDWDSCFDGQIHVWYQGTDFDTSTTSFRALVHRTANAREGGSWRAETRIDKNNNSVIFRFFEEQS